MANGLMRIFLFAIIISLFGCHNNSIPSKELSPVEKAELFFKQGDYVKATNLYCRLAGKDSSFYLNVGQCYGSLNNYRESVNAFSKYINFKNDNAWSYYARGLCFKQIGFTEKSFLDLKKAVSLDKTKSPYLVSLGLEYLPKTEGGFQFDIDKAINCFTMAIILDSTVEALYYRANCYYARGLIESSHWSDGIYYCYNIKSRNSYWSLALADYQTTAARDTSYSYPEAPYKMAVIIDALSRKSGYEVIQEPSPYNSCFVYEVITSVKLCQMDTGIVFNLIRRSASAGFEKAQTILIARDFQW
jgi:tetratricopeptide (TPR) repeat protein